MSLHTKEMIMPKNETVVLLGASDKPDRYAYMAFKLLQENGHNVILVSPRIDEVEGTRCFNDLSMIEVKIDTLTLYVNKMISSREQEKILALKPSRVIFNPGTENEELKEEFLLRDIECVEGCTLVMLRTGQF